ncbi:hypothetical protein CA236_01165 [Sphingomonas sp. ABOLG]|uniref:hypothetical protein n=1 Tax=Sphingomonas sp. ABOLG TaxID=1985880 RepID=UPI000F7F072A|nr:hypothetical protein [Sphingomonas sp. ABOLG]RSV20536.1 hypothetical protein CA236_01165 [Sphingomonas sp. ABOLG]
MSGDAIVSHIIDIRKAPMDFPTHRHAGSFWEQLGRCVATFGFLEEVLGKAIFAFSATTEVMVDEWEAAYAAWLPQLKKALSDQLGRLIDSYASAVRKHQAPNPAGFDEVIAELRAVAIMRNVICHGSWRSPDVEGRSLPFFTNTKGDIWEEPMDVTYLASLQRQTAELAAYVMSTVTTHGWQFPGTAGPGRPIWTRS